MAPEVVEGEEAGPPADVFSAGTVLYWLVCGALPFSGPNPAALFRRILESRFDPVLQRRPHAGRSLARLIEHCLQRAPDKRPSGAREVADALRSMLAEGGLVDLAAERAAYFREPEVYQEALARRLVPAYLAAARRALDAGSTARGLDFLDRVMAIDETHPEAQALLARVERGQRRSRLVRRGSVAVAGAAALGALAALLQVVLEEPPRAPDAGPVAQVETARPLPDLPDAGPFDASLDATKSLARAPDDAGSRAVAIHHPPRPHVVAPPTEPPPDAGPPPAPVRVTVRAFPKNVRVFVDGALHGEVWQVETDKPILLVPGTHQLRFEHPACQEVMQPITVRAGQAAAPVIFRCAWKPAYIRVQSNKPAEVRNEASGQVLGETNQDISFPMSQASARLALTIEGPEGSVRRHQFALVAGQRHVATVDF
jgi:serine/threonine-protein kinase